MKNLLLAALLSIGFSTAHAEIFNFSYTSNINGTLAGQLVGSLQADGNTVVVSSFMDFVKLNGIAGPSVMNINSTDFSNFGTRDLLPKVTLNGSFMDIIACNGKVTNCNDSPIDGFSLNQGNRTAATYGSNGQGFYGTDGFYAGAYGGFAQPFVASNWQISAVPEPTSTALLGLGLVTLFGAHSLKKKNALQCRRV